ncbi:hypothetical protein B0H14DRAFT_3043995 [Mycena olivaceomarginata]|nr:hypothetical protein B0H14DRAFT_3043995 [Mycena olivaceomarginata]
MVLGAAVGTVVLGRRGRGRVHVAGAVAVGRCCLRLVPVVLGVAVGVVAPFRLVAAGRAVRPYQYAGLGLGGGRHLSVVCWDSVLSKLCQYL